MKKIKPWLAGLLQALGVVLYCTILGFFMFNIEKIGEPPFAIIYVLTLLVFSAAVTGALVFGYPVHLALNKKMKEALSVFGFTLLFSFIAIVCATLLSVLIK